MFQFDTSKAKWIFPPKVFEVSDDKVVMVTEPGTDFWQRTYYGFQNDNGPALLLATEEASFSFMVKTVFNSQNQFDQCGIIIYQDSDNWFKASIEYEDGMIQRLGSVVTNHGYSDWATTDISADIQEMTYRLSRRGSDYCIENSYDGQTFKQMRIFHLFEGAGEIHFGVYACSPVKAPFTAEFSQIKVTECQWKAHGEE